MSLPTTLNRWLNDSPVSSADLSIFRILYSTFVLLTMFRADYAAFLPAIAFEPPPGPFALLSAPPPLPMIWLLQAALAVSLVMLGIGWRARTSAVAAGVLQIVIFGIGYSFGKIDHTILLPFVALVMAFSPWAATLSVDSYLPRRSVSGHPWAPRCLAIGLGVGMLTAGLPKLRGGWLSWDSQAAYGYLVLEKNVFNAPPESTAYLSLIHSPVVWEFLDYATVLLECGAVLLALSWRTFYPLIATLATFHFFIAMTMGIVFPYNLPVYAAFVPWSRLRLPVVAMDKLAAALAAHKVWRWTWCAVVACTGLLLAWLRPDRLVPTVYVSLLVVGAIVGLGYLAVFAWRLRSIAAGRVRGRSS